MSRLEGKVEGDEVLFEISAPNGERSFVALDTGFTGELALDPATAARLGFEPPSRVSLGEVADGSVARIEMSQGVILWLGPPRAVRAALLETSRGCIGMGVLRDVIVNIDTRVCTASITSAV